MTLWQVFASRAEAEASTEDVEFAHILGFYDAADGGLALFKREAEPSHPGKYQNAVGDWFGFVGPEVNWFQTGAIGDDTYAVTGTDDTDAVEDARDISMAIGIPVVVPALPPTRMFRLTRTVTHESAAVTYRGAGADVTVGATLNSADGGSWIHFDHSGVGLLFRDSAGPANSRKFARLSGLGFCRTQPEPGPGWAPSPHEEDIRAEFNVDLDDVLFLNPTKAVRIRSAGQLQTRRVRGQPLSIGFDCERSSDVQRWDGDHWWPYWSQDINVTNYTMANTLFYNVQRADGLFIDNPFGILGKRLFYAEDVNGALSGLANFHIVNPYADVGGGGIEIVANYYPAYGTIKGYLCNSSVNGAPSDGAAFRLRGTASSQVDVEMRSNRSPEEAVYISGPHKVKLDPGRFNGWSFVTAGRYMFKVTDGATLELLAEPDKTTCNGLYYSADATSKIVMPIKAAIGSAVTSGQGFSSRRISISDDGVAVLALPVGDKTANVQITPMSVPGPGNPAGSVWGRASASPSAAVIALSHTDNVALSTSVLTGTTGLDGNLTISFANNGNAYFENRTGSARSFILTILGG